MNLEEILTPAEIIERLIDILGFENDNQLAIYLGVERQQIRQFKQGKGGNLNCRMLTSLINQLSE